MAEQAKTSGLEREYIIPLRRHWLNVPQYERTGKAIKTIKKFIARHMKIADRDTEKVKLDIFFNNELWFRGRASPPSKVKVKAVREGNIVKVTFAEIPEHVKFLKARLEKRGKKAEKPAVVEKKEEAKLQELKEGKTEQEVKEEKEKEKSGEEQQIKLAEQQAKAQKHITKVKEPKIQRMALKK